MWMIFFPKLGFRSFKEHIQVELYRHRTQAASKQRPWKSTKQMGFHQRLRFSSMEFKPKNGDYCFTLPETNIAPENGGFQ